MHQVNQTAESSGGLAAVSMVNPDGTTSHHSEKASMEAACLDKAKARFTQADNPPFLTTPLIQELGLLNCNEPPFDAITHGHYQAPEGTNPGAQLLLQNLKQLAEVPDCKLELMESIHSKGWTKAKEQTTSSPLDTHFGHYKSGTFSELINAVHTTLSAIPLKTRYSYHRWKKGINIMLEKSPGNFQVDKLRIILLLKQILTNSINILDRK